MQVCFFIIAQGIDPAYVTYNCTPQAEVTAEGAAEEETAVVEEPTAENSTGTVSGIAQCH